MKYYIGASIIMDNIYYENEAYFSGLHGGAGIYALSGAKLWTDNVYLVSTISKKQRSKIQKFFRDNGLSMKYIEIIKSDLPTNRIEYYKDGNKIEKHRFNKKYLTQFEYSSDKLISHASEECGIYIFRNASLDFWKPLIALKKRKATILWRVAHDACRLKQVEEIQMISKHIDIISINFSNAQKLFSVNNLDTIIERLKSYKTPLIILTDVNEGMYFIKSGVSTFINYNQPEEVVDLTGSDDGISAAVLVGYTQGNSLQKIGSMANHSRILNVQQVGLPNLIKEYQYRKFLKE